jgi:hypothetical protein
VSTRVLTLRELNRATLDRQMLLERQAIPALDAVERLAGLQAQVPSPPYVGLWTRLKDFRREELTRLMEERQVVRATLMRATLHLMTAEDYLLLRPALQPALTRSMNSIAGKEEIKPELRIIRDENDNELLDLPDAALPSGDTPAPPRFVPDYDNLVLSHADRGRVISDEHRKKVFLSAARVRATFLIDGFVRGAWKVEKTRRTATLVIEPFERLSRGDRDALSEEGERLVRFLAEPQGAEMFDVSFA